MNLLGFVKNLKISGDDIKFELQLTTPACPVRDQFVTECEKAIRGNIENAGKIDIKMSSNVQKNTHAMKEDILCVMCFFFMVNINAQTR